jgi:3-dehydroquinate dehydratase/shikimate dehydrogenase
MKNGKICLSICADTLDNWQFGSLENIDLVELRLDCVKNLTNLDFLTNLTGSFILTYRPKEQGGRHPLSKQERLDFWRKLKNLKFKAKILIDCEFDLFPEASSLKFNKIASFHCYTKAEGLEKIYEDLCEKAEIIKIAVFAEEATEAVELWKLLNKAVSEGKKLIPIAMGEGGKWTRILGLAHGACLTYAVTDETRKTAPGQLTVFDLTEIYRIKQLSRETDVYAIIAGNTEYSMSPYMHNIAFRHHGLNSVFVPMQVKNLREFMRRMVKETREIELNFKGFAVTNPHKEAIIEYLDEVDSTAREIGAVNTVKIEGNLLKGFNTDYKGFIEPLLNLYGDLKGARVAVFGAGGASRACIYALKKHDAEVVVFARNLKKAKALCDEFEVELRPMTKKPLEDFDILVNATPLGTKGEFENQSVADAEQMKKLKLVYDLVYNPFQTKLMKEADEAQIPKIGGLAMLVAQAIEQQRIWTGLETPMKEMSEIVLRKLINLT